MTTEEYKIKNVAIVSLSRGLLGEGSVRHEVEIGVRRLEEYGLAVRFMPHALKGIEYVENHPEKRAEDLLAALRDPGIDMILCAIGGDDTYRLLPYLFDHGELAAAADPRKIFLGFSDTTVNHFMLRKVGMKTFYGQAFLPDVCELGDGMHPYSRMYFETLLREGTIRTVRPSSLWCEERKSFGPDQIGVPLKAHPDPGFDHLQGARVFSGEILGGCLDTLYDFFNGDCHADMPVLCKKYGLFPTPEEWAGKILLLETSEEKMPPEKFRKAVAALKDAGVFGAVSGVLLGRPMDKTFEKEYKEALLEGIGDPDLPVVANIAIGHAQPRCIIPFGVPATVDVGSQAIRFAR